MNPNTSDSNFGMVNKTRYYNLLEIFEAKWDNYLSKNFSQEQKESTAAQLIKSKRLLDEAENEKDLRAVENRMRKLEDWIKYNKPKSV